MHAPVKRAKKAGRTAAAFLCVTLSLCLPNTRVMHTKMRGHTQTQGSCCWLAVKDLTLHFLLQMLQLLLLLMLTAHKALSHSKRHQQTWQRDRWGHTAEELTACLGRIMEENTHSSVSPGILSLSRWAFMAELCSFALLWSWYIFTQPAACPPPALTKS